MSPPDSAGPTGQFGALILAAGSSRRFAAETGGENKLLARLGGRPLIRQVVEGVQAAVPGPVMVVTGYQAARIEEALAGLDVALVHAPEHGKGMAHSLKAGVAALCRRDRGLEAFFLCLGDMPFIDSGVLAEMMAVFRQTSPAPIVIPVYAGRRGHPVLFPCRLAAEFAGLAGDRGARPILEAHGAEIVEIPGRGAGILRDLDRPSDFG